MTDTMTSQNIDLSSWDILYMDDTIYYKRFPKRFLALHLET